MSYSFYLLKNVSLPFSKIFNDVQFRLIILIVRKAMQIFGLKVSQLLVPLFSERTFASNPPHNLWPRKPQARCCTKVAAFFAFAAVTKLNTEPLLSSSSFAFIIPQQKGGNENREKDMK
jgi:hypothetical protein